MRRNRFPVEGRFEAHSLRNSESYRRVNLPRTIIGSWRSWAFRFRRRRKNMTQDNNDNDLQSLRAEQAGWTQKVGELESKFWQIKSRKARVANEIDCRMKAVPIDLSILASLELEAEELAKDAGFVLGKLAA